MDKNVLAALALDESKTFTLVEPLHCSLFFHLCFPFLFELFDVPYQPPAVNDKRECKCELAFPSTNPKVFTRATNANISYHICASAGNGCYPSALLPKDLVFFVTKVTRDHDRCRCGSARSGAIMGAWKKQPEHSRRGRFSDETLYDARPDLDDSLDDNLDGSDGGHPVPVRCNADLCEKNGHQRRP